MATDPLLRRLSGLSWPTTANDQPDPTPGQLWRAMWANDASLVLVIEPPDRRTVRVLGVTADRIGDDEAVVADTNHGLRPSVWAGVSAVIKTFTLEHRVTDLTEESFAAVTAVAGGRRQGDWPPITNDLDDRSLARARLAGTLDSLSEAEWNPAADPGASSLAAQAAAAGIPPSRVADALGITPGAARRLLQGQREPSAAEVALLANMLGTAPAVAVKFDDALVASLDLPEFRPRLRLIANDVHDGDETAARRAFAGRMMALAARHREPGRRNWATLIRETLGAR